MFNFPQFTSKKITFQAACFLLLTAIFSLIYTQAPLYTSNQNLYFLYGLANAARGSLSADWLANTTDPTPLFSIMVRLLASLPAGETGFYLLYALLQGVYLINILGILDYLFDLRPTAVDWQALLGRSPDGNAPRAARALVILSAVLLLHSAALRFAFSIFLGGDWIYLLEGGVAGQRVLGVVLQPSVFAVFLVASINLGLRRRWIPAVLCAALAATFHPTYLLAAALLTIIWMFQQWQTSAATIGSWLQPASWRCAMLSGGLALICIAPILFITAAGFTNTTAAEATAARDVLVNFRFPYHARPEVWWNTTVVVKLIICALALWLVRNSRLLFVMVALSLAVLSLTILQILTASTTLALLFPWRLSILIVPLSASTLTVWGICAFWQRLNPNIKSLRLISAACIMLIVILMGIGAIRFKLDFERKAAAQDRSVALFASHNLSAKSMVLVPVKMEDFRINAGLPVYVDFKSHPYRGEEVLEWYRRMQLATRFYNKKDCLALKQIIAEGASYVVIPSAETLNCPQSGQILTTDSAYRLIILKR